MIALARTRASRLLLALAATAVLAGCFHLASAQARDFEIPTFVTPGVSKDQSPSIGAGARPYELVNNFVVNQTPTPEELFNGGHIGPAGNVKDVTFEMPPGIIANAASFPRCTQEAFHGFNCPTTDQIGVATIGLTAGQGGIPYPVFNMVPPPGVPAQFAFRVIASNVHLNFHISGRDRLRPDRNPARPQRGDRPALLVGADLGRPRGSQPRRLEADQQRRLGGRPLSGSAAVQVAALEPDHLR